jgi:hypothetical protein
MGRSQRRTAFWGAAAVIALVAAVPGCQRSKYVIGRDTVAVFGDWRFQIVSIASGMALVDEENRDVVL